MAKEKPKPQRADHQGPLRTVYQKNKRKIFATQQLCGICGQLVDFSKKNPHPLSPVIDHIIPISKGGHPADISNMQLAHYSCNRQKSDKLAVQKWKKNEEKSKPIGNYDLPQSMDWKNYQAKD